ncbi:MAG: hypothetical protein GDA55_05055 [Cellvibrionales bacterium]|nr:hypothetical protein [Cellvibrionales bacterium]
MNPDNFLTAARRLADSEGPGRPRQVDLRRAVSTTYYALFHTVCRSAADLLIGANPASRSNPAWRQMYRAINHGPAKIACSRQKIKEFPQSIQGFAAAFVDAQDKTSQRRL